MKPGALDASLVLREFPPPYSLETLLHAAGRLGFEAATREAAADGIAAIGTPCVVVLAGVPIEGADAPAHRLAVVTRATETELQLVEPGRAGPATVTPEGFAARFTGLVVQFALAGRLAAQIPTPGPRRHRCSVSAGSSPSCSSTSTSGATCSPLRSAIQLIALADPALHAGRHRQGRRPPDGQHAGRHRRRTRRRHAVQPAMSWVRQYLVLHTGNRVDAVLGTRVFEHLVELPAALSPAPADRRGRRADPRRRDDPPVRQRRRGDAAARPARSSRSSSR